MLHAIEECPWPIDGDPNIIPVFPAYPIPDSISHIRDDLLAELTQAEAPLTDRRTACVLVTRDKGYGGHSLEQADGTIVDAVSTALDNLPPEAEEILAVLVTGTGRLKEKHTLPSYDAYNRLSPLLAPKAPFVVVKPGSHDSVRWVTPQAYRPAYEIPAESYAFQGRTAEQIMIEAIRNTTLNMRDCGFLVELRLAGLREATHYYLTGSASALGGPSNALNQAEYDDVDIIAVSDADQSAIEASFEHLVRNYYGTVAREPHPVTSWPSRRVLEAAQYITRGASFDLFVGKTLADAVFRTETVSRNFFHQLS